MEIDPNKAIEAIGNNLPINEAYSDLLRPLAHEIGRGLGTVGRAVNLALLPLAYLVYRGEQIRDALMPDLEARLANVPPGRTQTPPVEVAGPVYEALRFTAQNDDLRRLFANLLATSMDQDTAQLAHPAFAEILKQISPDEARLLTTIAAQGPHIPTLAVRALHEANEAVYKDALRDFNLLADDAGCAHPQFAPVYLRNLLRLGVIAQVDGKVAGTDYRLLEQHPEVQKVVNAVLASGGRPRFEQGAAEVTALGRVLLSACVNPGPSW